MCCFRTNGILLMIVALMYPTVVDSFPYPYENSPKYRSFSCTNSKAVVPGMCYSTPSDDIYVDGDDDDSYYPNDLPSETTIVGSLTDRAQPPPPNADPSQPHRTVIVVDDEQSFRTAVAAYLTSSIAACTVAAFPSAEAALDHLESLPLSSPLLPSAIVSDIRMEPGMDGIQFLSTLRRSTHRDPARRAYYGTVPVVMLTAKGNVGDRIRGWEVGCDGYLPKPFDPEELVGMLEGVMDRYEFMRRRALDRAERDRGVGGLKKDLEEIRNLILMEDGERDGDGSVTIESEASQVATAQRDEANDSAVVLSMDELDVLELLCQGKMNKEMASELKYSIRWVEGHLTSMYRKTGCSNRTELVRWAVAMGYVDMFGG